MPLINIYSSASKPTSDDAQRLLTTLSSLLARELVKPESYVMTNLVRSAEVTFGGTFDPVCYAEIKNIGKFTPQQTERISGQVCDIVTQFLGVGR